MIDFAAFAGHWMQTNCNALNNWCGGADVNHINDVDIEDLAAFASYWLK